MAKKYELLTDDDLAGILSKEGNEYALRYSTIGLAARHDRRCAISKCSLAFYHGVNWLRLSRPTNHPKPNQKFLQQIIRSTENHNAALLAKEAAESRARLHELEEAAEQKRRRLNPTASEIRQKQLRAISLALESRKQESRPKAKTTVSEAVNDRNARDGPRDRKSETSRSESGRDASRTRNKRERSKSPCASDRKYRDRSSRTSDHKSSRHGRHRSRSPRRKRSSSRRRSPSPRRSPSRRSPSRRSRSRRRSQSPARTKSGRRKRSYSADRENRSDSDPLDEYVSSKKETSAPARVWGRGAPKGTAAMDRLFRDDYDPKTDIDPESLDTDNWEDELEAYRDRQKFKAQQAARLKSAGFTDDQIKKWDRGSQKDESDVRWSKKGEIREWDRGKDTVDYFKEGRSSSQEFGSDDVNRLSPWPTSD